MNPTEYLPCKGSDHPMQSRAPIVQYFYIEYSPVKDLNPHPTPYKSEIISRYTNEAFAQGEIRTHIPYFVGIGTNHS